MNHPLLCISFATIFMSKDGGSFTDWVARRQIHSFFLDYALELRSQGWLVPLVYFLPLQVVFQEADLAISLPVTPTLLLP